MEVLFVFLVIGLLFAPIIMSAASLGRSSDARRGVEALRSQLSDVSERVDAIKRHLEQLQRARPVAAFADEAAAVSEPAAEPATAPAEALTSETWDQEPAVVEDVPMPEPVPEPADLVETQEELAAPEAEEWAAEPAAEAFAPAPEPVVPPPAAAGPTFADTAVAKARGLEEKIAANWLVWVGGVAVALAGVFLVRYAAEQGWLSPALRCAAGVLLGLASWWPARSSGAARWSVRSPPSIPTTCRKP